MKSTVLAATLSGIVVMSSPAYGQIVHPLQDCNVVQDASFQENFNFMVTNGEGCIDNKSCKLIYPHWQNDPVFQIFVSTQNNKSYQSLREKFQESIRKISFLTGLRLSFANGKTPSVSIFILDDEMIATLLAQDFSNEIKKELTDYHFKIYAKGSCSFTGFSDEASKSKLNVLSSAMIFVNANLSEPEMTNCLREELMNTMGLVGDPIGQASLFDNGNYVDDNGIKDYSRKTELMLYALYQIAKGKYDNVEDFVARSCKK